MDHPIISGLVPHLTANPHWVHVYTLVVDWLFGQPSSSPKGIVEHWSMDIGGYKIYRRCSRFSRICTFDQTVASDPYIYTKCRLPCKFMGLGQCHMSHDEVSNACSSNETCMVQV